MSKKYRRIEPMTQTIKTDAVATAGAKLTISVPSTMTKEQSEKLAGAFRSQITDANGYRLLANGSIEILVTIDEDIAGGLLASADQAGMPTVDYIPPSDRGRYDGLLGKRGGLMPVNDWVVGGLYVPNYNGVPWSQTGGPGTPVLPADVTGNFDLLSTVAFNTLTGQYIGVCGHSFNMVVVFRSYDYLTASSVALLCCPQCSCVQRTIEPFSEAVGGDGSLVNAILYP